MKKLGCTPSVHKETTLSIRNYITPTLVYPPEAAWHKARDSWASKANNEHGCCVTLGVKQLLDCYHALASFDFISIPDSTVILEATQNDALEGWSILECLETWRDKGMFGNKLDAFAAIPLGRPGVLKAMIYELGGVKCGVQLPEDWMQTTTWESDRFAHIAGGHDIVILGYDADWYYGISWGEVVRISQAAIDNHFFELWAPVNELWYKDRETPSGFDSAALIRDTRAL